MAKITVYSTPTCPFCKMEKQYLKDKKIEFKDIDVSTDQDKAREMIAKSGQMGVPVTVVEDEGKEQVIVGFNETALDQAIGVK